MKKNALNILVDLLSLFTFILMIITGLIIKFILPPGSGRLERLLIKNLRPNQTIDTWLNLTRHGWGEVHFYIACLFLGLMAAHLILHWPWIKATFLGARAQRAIDPQRKILIILFIGILVFLILVPWLIPIKTYTAATLPSLYPHSSH